MPDVYALPYVDHSPELAWVVEHEGHATGYIIAAADTRAFADWWAREWTPGFVARHPAPGPATGRDPGYTEAQLLHDGADPERMVRGLRHGELTTHPAHLHIDLLPVLQRRGLGSRLIDTLRAASRSAACRACTSATPRRTPRPGRSTTGTGSRSSPRRPRRRRS